MYWLNLYSINANWRVFLMVTQCIKSEHNLQFPNISFRKWRKSTAVIQHAWSKIWVLHNCDSCISQFSQNTNWLVFYACSYELCVCVDVFPPTPQTHTNTHTSYLHPSLPPLCAPHRWRCTWAGRHQCHRPGGGCGCRAAGGGQSWHTPSAKHRYTHRLKPCISMKYVKRYIYGVPAPFCEYTALW